MLERRVDLVAPAFSNPTNVTSRLFPITRIRRPERHGRRQAVSDRDDASPRHEDHRVEPGQCVRTLVSQYFAYLDGRIQEVALDFYAQADDGSVWYFGEDVYNYRHGVVADTSGTWLAGKEGPAAMIMPADDPRSHATGAATTRARLAARVCGGRVRALAVGRLHGSCDEPCLAGASRQRRATQARRPMSRALRVLERTARARSPLTARDAALDVRQAALDLKLRFRPPAEIDRPRFDLWARRVGVDARRRHHAAVAGAGPGV